MENPGWGYFVDQGSVLESEARVTIKFNRKDSVPGKIQSILHV